MDLFFFVCVAVCWRLEMVVLLLLDETKGLGVALLLPLAAAVITAISSNSSIFMKRHLSWATTLRVDYIYLLELKHILTVKMSWRDK